MQDHELRRQEPPKIWDNTMRTTFRSCNRKFYYFLRRFTYSNDTMPVYFTFGRAYHQGMLTWHTSTIPDPMLRCAAAVGKAIELWKNEAPTEKPPLDTLANLVRKIEGYANNWGISEDWTFVPGGAEAGWIWPLNSTYELAGAMDGYVNWPERGIFSLEHKTTGEYLIPRYREGFHSSTQITGYIWYLHQLMPKENIFGAIVNMVTKNIKTPTSKWRYPEYDREHVRKLQWQLDEFEEDFTYDLAQFEKCWNDWHWPKTGQALYNECSGGPGKSPCLFRRMCATPLPLAQLDPKRFIGITETAEPWEPWKREGEA